MPPLEQLVLERIGSSDATIGVISLPLPEESASCLRIDHALVGAVPVGWWRRHKVPRRVMAYALFERGVPETLRLTQTPPPAAAPSRAWTVERRTTFERLHYMRDPFHYRRIDHLRGFPAESCTTVESEVLLNFAGQKCLRLRIGATRPGGGGAYDWQNVQIDPLWENPVAQAFRIGGIIYNSDTFLWADLYLVLFSNGVADVAAHFVNTKLHVDGLDFRGLPMIWFGGDFVRPLDADLTSAEHDLDLGGLKLNVADAAILMSEKHPGRIRPDGDQVVWYPFRRTFHTQHRQAPEDQWAPGFARTVRFQLSLSDAPPRIARFRAPNWWYALCSDTWSGGFLPVRGRFDRLAEEKCDRMRQQIVRGRFDGGSAESANDGDVGIGLWYNFYHTGRPELLNDALDYCYYWADLAVDHRDFSIHQWLGGWPWKTCAYSKFRDVLMGFLETGDPYLLDVCEMCAESYWQWFRANWPRCTIGRDAFSLGAWALMWRFFDTEHARERCTEFVRMIRAVLDGHGRIGGQMGGGPHPGYLSSLYMTGIVMSSLLDVAEAQKQMAAEPVIEGIPDLLHRLSNHYMRQNVEMFPSSHGKPQRRRDRRDWFALACRIYPLLVRLQGFEDDATRAGLGRCLEPVGKGRGATSEGGRPGMQMIHPIVHDALMLGARWMGDGVRLEPIGRPAQWPAEQVVATPLGKLHVTVKPGADGVVLHFDAPTEFPVEVGLGDWTGRTSSRRSLVLEPSALADPA